MSFVAYWRHRVTCDEGRSLKGTALVACDSMAPIGNKGHPGSPAFTEGLTS